VLCSLALFGCTGPGAERPPGIEEDELTEVPFQANEKRIDVGALTLTATIDLDRDGRPDLVGVQDSTLYAVRLTGQIVVPPTFDEATLVESPLGLAPTLVDGADLNGDGFEEIVLYDPRAGAIEVLVPPTDLFDDPALGFDDPALGFDDPALGFDDPALGFDDPALGFDDPALGARAGAAEQRQ